MVKQIKKALMLCILQSFVFILPTQAQESTRAGVDSHKFFYGLHAGFAESKVNLYYPQSGGAQELKEGNHSFFVPGFRLAVIGGVRLGDYFSLRVMPGVSIFSDNWESDGVTVAGVPGTKYNVESVCGELPVDVKFHPFRTGMLRPFLTSGLCYGFDFTTQNNGVIDKLQIQRLDGSDLRYTCGVGVDCDVSFLRIGVEFKASFGLLSPGNGSNGSANDFYFDGGPSFSIGLNIEA